MMTLHRPRPSPMTRHLQKGPAEEQLGPRRRGNLLQNLPPTQRPEARPRRTHQSQRELPLPLNRFRGRLPVQKRGPRILLPLRAVRTRGKRLPRQPRRKLSPRRKAPADWAKEGGRPPLPAAPDRPAVISPPLRSRLGWRPWMRPEHRWRKRWTSLSRRRWTMTSSTCPPRLILQERSPSHML